MTTFLSVAGDPNAVGDAIDCSAFALLRFTVSLGADLGLTRDPPYVDLAFQHSADGQEWETLLNRRFDAGANPRDAHRWRASTPIAIGSFYQFVRVAVSGRVAGGVTLDVSADGIPSA